MKLEATQTCAQYLCALSVLFNGGRTNSANAFEQFFQLGVSDFRVQVGDKQLRTCIMRGKARNIGGALNSMEWWMQGYPKGAVSEM